jgi:hypothetical protein
VQAACAVAQRPLRDLGEQPTKLILAHHAMRAQHVEQPLVDLGQRTGRRGGGRTTSPDDTTPAAGTILNHGQKTWARGRPETQQNKQSKKVTGIRW